MGAQGELIVTGGQTARGPCLFSMLSDGSQQKVSRFERIHMISSVSHMLAGSKPNLVTFWLRQPQKTKLHIKTKQEHSMDCAFFRISLFNVEKVLSRGSLC